MMFFFFKQNTAYDMRICDWSSDVCSSDLGEVRAVGPALEAYRPTDAQIVHELERFIRNVRALPLDPVVLRDHWLEAYDFASSRGATALNAYARERDPFSRVGKATVAVEVTSEIGRAHV